MKELVYKKYRDKLYKSIEIEAIQVTKENYDKFIKEPNNFDSAGDNLFKMMSDGDFFRFNYSEYVYDSYRFNAFFYVKNKGKAKMIGSYGMICEKDLQKYYEEINTEEEKMQEEKLYSLKYALDALEKGFKIKEMSGWGMNKLDFLNLGDLACLERDIFKKCFKILPKKETVKKYPALIEELVGAKGVFIDKMGNGKPVFYRNLREVEQAWAPLNYYKIIGLVTYFPELIKEETIEIQYDETMFGRGVE